MFVKKGQSWGVDEKRASYFVIDDNLTLVFDLTEGVDKEKEIVRLEKNLSKLQKEMSSLWARLENPHFKKKAPLKVVEGVQKEYEALKVQKQECEENLSKLKNL